MESTLRFLSFMAVDGADLSRALCVGGMSTLTASGSAEVFTSTLVTQIPEPPSGRAPITWNWKAPSTPPERITVSPEPRMVEPPSSCDNPFSSASGAFGKAKAPGVMSPTLLGEKLDDSRVEDGADQDPFGFRRGGGAHDDGDRLAQDWVFDA